MTASWLCSFVAHLGVLNHLSLGDLCRILFIMCFSFLPQGVTYCGESKASTLTMQNVPWHEEVTLLKLLTLPTNSDSFDQAGFNNLDCCPLNFNCLFPLILLHLH